MRTALTVAGVVLWFLGALGAIQLLTDHQDAGLLSWLPGGLTVQLACYLVVVMIGVVLTARNAPWRQGRTSRN